MQIFSISLKIKYVLISFAYIIPVKIYPYDLHFEQYNKMAQTHLLLYNITETNTIFLMNLLNILKI